MSSLCCIIGCDRPLSDASRHRRQTRRPYTSSTIAPSSPLASTANNTSTNQSRRSLSGASSPSHTMSSRGQGMTEGVADVASETLRSSGRLSKHTTTSSPKTERYDNTFGLYTFQHISEGAYPFLTAGLQERLVFLNLILLSLWHRN